MDLKLAGKKALVTGSSKGIGEAIARKLALEHAIVIVHGRNRVLATTVADDIIAHGGRAYVVTGDLTHDDEVQQLVNDAEAFAGPIDIVVNNAGGSGRSTENWADSRLASWTAAYDRNVLAALRVSTRLLPKMQQAGWGRVVNISSLAATMPPASRADYSACKAALNAMTASMAKAVASDGVTVNAVSPGTIHSPALDGASARPLQNAGWRTWTRRGPKSNVWRCPSSRRYRWVESGGWRRLRTPLPFL